MAATELGSPQRLTRYSPHWSTLTAYPSGTPASTTSSKPPASPVAEGTEWVVQMRASGRRWPSPSRALVITEVRTSLAGLDVYLQPSKAGVLPSSS